MSDFLTIAETIKELGSTILIVAASVWLLAKFLPNQMKQQGETQEVIRNNSAVIEACTEVLRLVAVKDEELKASLQRMEEELSMTTRDVRYLKIQSDLKGMNDE